MMGWLLLLLSYTHNCLAKVCLFHITEMILHDGLVVVNNIITEMILHDWLVVTVNDAEGPEPTLVEA